jgi:hypothetical protein
MLRPHPPAHCSAGAGAGEHAEQWKDLALTGLHGERCIVSKFGEQDAMCKEAMVNQATAQQVKAVQPAYADRNVLLHKLPEGYYLGIMRWSITIVIVIWSIGAWAQWPLTLRVVDGQNGHPLGYATVVFHGTVRGTITNADGYFSIPDPPGVDSLRISFVGYRTRLVAVADLPSNGRIPMPRTAQELAEFTVMPGDPQYERVAALARRLRTVPAIDSRLFFGMETYSDSVPVEMIHAFYNARYSAARLEKLVLKQGRIGVMAKDGRYFINYNTTRAFALLDILTEDSYFPPSPLAHTKARQLRRSYIAEQLSAGSGPDGVDHLRVTPREHLREAFTLDLWLGSTDDRVRALELHCTRCPKHPFLPLFDHGRIDTVDLRYKQTWSTSGPALPEVMELSYRMVYTGPDFTETFRTDAVMHAYDRSSTFITPLFEYSGDLPDYHKIGWLPADSLFWTRVRPPLPTDRQRSAMDFLLRNDLREGSWVKQLGSDQRFFSAHYAEWSAKGRIMLHAISTRDPRESSSKVTKGVLADYAISMEGPKVSLVAQIYLDLDTVNGQLLHRSTTVLDGFQSYYLEQEHPWTACLHNIWFDLCEMERRAMEVRLNVPGLSLQEARTIHAEHSIRLKATTQHFLRETRYGEDREALGPWNDRVKAALGIDNIAVFGL